VRDDERDVTPPPDQRHPERLQELLENGLSPEEREEAERWVSAAPEREGELARLRSLDALLTEAVPAAWSEDRTRKTLDTLGLAPAAANGAGVLLRVALTAAAAVLALLVYGGPLLGRIQAAPDRLRTAGAGMLEGWASRAGALEALPAGPVVLVAGLLLLATLTIGARTARTLPSRPENRHG